VTLFDPIRDEPRYRAMVADAGARLRAAKPAEGAEEAGSAKGRFSPLASVREAAVRGL